MRELTDLLKKEKALTLTGFLGLVLGGLCQSYILLFGAQVGLEGDLAKAVSFNIALGIFLLTTAIIVSFANFSRKTKMIFRCFYIITSLYSYGIETIQHFRGIDPRFTQVGSPLDGIFGLLFGLVAIAMIVFYVILAMQFFSKGSMKTKRLRVILGIRYGMFSTMLAFAAGIWIITMQSRFIGESGNIIWLHGLGFHGLQLVPLIAWLLEKQSRFIGMRMIHLSGLSWSFFIILIALQTMLGRTIFEMSYIMVGAVIFFVISIGILAIVIYTVLKDRNIKSSISQNV
ncbi:hypothetical protein [Halalkalibacter lacteus]|uniref:hypothetical protein n=1 Tax=Halalkalibacter lacteus TaxID=3090663 RepID=UPI002FC5B6FB